MQLIYKQKRNFLKHTAICFAVCLLTVFILGSCKKKSVPEPNYMNFILTQGGNEVSTSSELEVGSTYQLSIEQGSDVVISTANYDISYSPASAITINSQKSNVISFKVNSGVHQTVTIIVTHKDDSFITETLVLSIRLDFMNFILTNGSGIQVASPNQLFYGGTYILTVVPVNGVTPATANYKIIHSPASAITINTSTTNSVNFTVNNTSATTITFTATHKDDSSITESLVLSLKNPPTTTFQDDIENSTTVPDLGIANELTQEVLKPLGAELGATLVKRYVTESGMGISDGSSWANAWAATSLRNNINAITDASTGKVYLIMIAGGTYKPSTSRGDSFSMKNRVAIMGGFQTGGGWERTGTTVFSGDIGTVGSAGDNTYHVFNHNTLTLNNAHLYGVNIIGGNANGGGDQGNGGGMYNRASSPVLTSVAFIGNIAIYRGGGLYNTSSSTPVLNKVVFRGNNVAASGGGMYNTGASAPVINNAIFDMNSADASGGAMYNNGSTPLIRNTVFSGNTADNSGGGMANFLSSPVIVGVVFTGNSATRGGGMYNENDGQVGPRIINTIFSANTATSVAPDIGLERETSGGAENITIAGSVLGTYLTTGQPADAIVGFDGSAPLNINNYSLSRNAVNLGTATLTVNGMNYTYSTITAGSSAIDLGLYVRKDGSTYYYSEDNSTWYTGFTTGGTGGLAGTAVALPTTSTIEDMTATDITGKVRAGRPDAGVSEL